MGDRYGKYGGITIEDVDKMIYTRATVKETLRYRPPVIMVPYMVKKDYPVTPTYTAPKGSMLIPSTWLSLHDPEAYPTHGGADEFAPERWTEADAEDKGKNWLVFGTGPHYCLGQTYAVMNLMIMLHLLAANYDWHHHITPTSEDIRVFATIFPMDDLFLSFTRRDVNAA